MIEKITKYSSIVTSVFAAGVVLYGVFRFIDQSNKNTDTNKIIMKQFDSRKSIDSISNLRLDTLTKMAKMTYHGVISTNEKIEKIRNQFTLHLSKDKSVTKEELLQIINDLDEKKNKRDTIWIPWW
jgi:hypothetical protein